MGYKATEQRPKTTQLVDDDQLNNILGTKMESGQLICSNDYKDYSELEEDTQVGDLIKPQPFESINGRPEGTYGGVDIYKDNRITVLTPEDSGEDSYIFIFKQGNATNLNFSSLSGYTNAQIELVGGGGGGQDWGSGGQPGSYDTTETYVNIKTSQNYPITVGKGGAKGKAGETSKFTYPGNFELSGSGGKTGLTKNQCQEGTKYYTITNKNAQKRLNIYQTDSTGKVFTGAKLTSPPKAANETYLPMYLSLKSNKLTSKKEVTKKWGDAVSTGVTIYNLIEGGLIDETQLYYPIKTGDRTFFEFLDGINYFEITYNPVLSNGWSYTGTDFSEKTPGIFKIKNTYKHGGTYKNVSNLNMTFGYGGKGGDLGGTNAPLYLIEKDFDVVGMNAYGYEGRNRWYWLSGREETLKTDSGKQYYAFIKNVIDRDDDNIDHVLESGSRYRKKFVYQPDANGTLKIVSRRSLNLIPISDHISANLSNFQPNASGTYYLSYDTSRKKYFWYHNIKFTNSGDTNISYLPTATQAKGGDGVVILKLTKPK